ncbi:neuronal acetylcholine receptor subunit alpha-9-like [Mercenaria mercenaria]|uniref:neuronal acetylcholine receptor subunit alpha-9-like n=1 Tax=Mercenaria mercenaria TaxID=6596 RepID=UPI00234E423A|nr:neuronal acetylcholine receptor subunit alpha-9-like [Mercenaria mercenaria]
MLRFDTVCEEKTLFFICISVLLSSIQSVGAYSYEPNYAAALETDLFATYAKKHRPQSKTDIVLEFGLMHITELDIVTQRLYSVGFLSTYWFDGRLQWTPSGYGNMTSFIPLVTDIWTPPLVLSNAADEIKLLNDNSNFESCPVFLHFNGFVIWLVPANFIAQCTINIKYYPFDSQSCNILVTSWLYADSQVDLSAQGSKINLDIYEEHGEWEISGTSVEASARVLNGYSNPAIKFTVNLKRKYSYYLLNMLLPVIVLAAMAPFVFILPVESGEKIGFALTILLSLSVVMTVVSDNIPPTSTNICVLSVYLLIIFIICSLETLATVITCRIHELHNKTYVMGDGCQNAARILSRITRYRRRPKICDITAFKEEHNLKEIQADVPEKNDLSKQLGRNNNAWTENENEDAQKEEGIKMEYTYEDIVIMYETFNLVLFTVLTSLITITFMVVLHTNAGESN